MLTQLLYEQVATRPDHVAIVHREERITFADLLDRVERLAAGLGAHGVGAGDAVGLVLHDEPWYIVAFHAVTGLGATVVPVNPAFKRAEIDFCFRSCRVSAIITDERTAGVCERVAAALEGPVQVISTSPGHGQAVTLDDLVERSAAQSLAPRAADEVLVQQFSSGSTGRPKRVPRTHGQCVAEAALYASLGIGGEDRVFSAIPLFHSWGQGACLFTPAATGATVVLLEDPHPFLLRRHRALELLERERITILPGVPFNYRLMAEAPADADLSSLRLAFSAGTALQRESFEAFGERFGVLVRQLYGSTETGVIAANMSDDPVATFDSVGRPLEGVSIEIIDDDGVATPTGEAGEVVVKSPAASSGYAEADPASQAALRDGCFHTGDLGSLDDEGLLRLEGRKKLLIEVGGYKVDPLEVEDVIASHPQVKEVVVVGVAGERPGEETVKAVIVPVDEIDEAEVMALCRERLANFKVPRQLELREEIPKSPIGKILRKYLV